MYLNSYNAIGKIENDPLSSKNSSGKTKVFFNLMVNRRIRDQNGQWVDNYSKVPCYADGNKADAVINNCTAGQEVSIQAYYQSWEKEDGSLAHGMVLQSISFGYKPNRS
jgi:single-stranded DNA-binding protein